MKLFTLLALLSFIFAISVYSRKIKVGENDPNLEQIGSWLKSLFASYEKCLPFVVREMKSWKIYKMDTEKKSNLEISLDEIVDKIDSPSDHIDKIVSCASKNSYLVNAVENGKEKFMEDYNSWDDKNKETFKKVSKEAVCYSVFLTYMTTWLESDYERASNFFDFINTSIAEFAMIDIRGLRYYSNMDLFGNIKTNTVFLMMKSMMNDIKNKVVLTPDAKVCKIRLNRISINIAEAMYFDSSHGFKDNALAGSALLVTPAYEKIDTNLETEPPKYSSGGVYQVFQPFPDEWADLYEVWNMAFTAQEMKEWPMYWAKLLTPAVGCYRDLKGSYLFQRAINLALHIVHQLITKNKRHSNDPDYDLRTMSFVKSFGTSNKASADLYMKKVQENDSDKTSVERRKRKLNETNEIVNSISEGSLSLIRSFPSLIQKFVNLGINECLNPIEEINSNEESKTGKKLKRKNLSLKQNRRKQ